MSARGRRLTAVLVVLAPLVLWLASTHRQAPLNLVTWTEGPGEVRLTFSADADPALSHVAVAAADGRQIEAGPVGAEPGHVLRVPVLGDGGYTVAYHVVGAAGDEVSGVLGTGEIAAHEHGIDPLSAVFLVLDLIAVLTVGTLLLRRPVRTVDDRT
ncbi:hypothetical protein GCM10010168_45520 [Actinoplanes ianthinogenes]|uniref:CopC domain-containing protein n=1 Tax=Actinoplanes ianthinogenes TaxID=122358 RepID=A0ABM7LPL2_9ACTN|nr:copper resistance CopC family protein [Actinoplanes ianthinogenes]BCJ41150.1 hypothetical protein Aiant_18070 [Actinoplanes ianthinogenes]GGR22562.1 hypothetical protein GCM10010168_45520 [Actinoplanes ianthinogenes]